MMNTEQVPIFRGNGVLEYVERPRPELAADDDVIVRIEACGLSLIHI